MKKAIDRRQFGIGAAAALAAGGRARAQSGQGGPLKIRVGWVVVPASTAPLVLEKKELLTHFGRSYVGVKARRPSSPRWRRASSILGRWRFRHSALRSRMRIW